MSIKLIESPTISNLKNVKWINTKDDEWSYFINLGSQENDMIKCLVVQKEKSFEGYVTLFHSSAFRIIDISYSLEECQKRTIEKTKNLLKSVLKFFPS